MNGRNHNELLKEVFDAMPSMVFVVDYDVRIQEYNKAAADFIDLERNAVIKKHGGIILNCIHSGKKEDKCGLSDFCDQCIIRNSVKKAYDGDRVIRVRTKLDILKGDESSEIYALITATPLNYQKEKLVLLVIEDISIIAELQRLIPICSICHKIRDENNVWSRIEAYFKESWDVDFTHGICPDCHEKEMEQLRSRKKTAL